jgi:HEAT repeat protein
MLAAHREDPRALEITRGLLNDPDDGVRSQATWSLGTLGDASDLPRLEPLAHGAALEVAVNAVAAIGRIAVREHATASAVQSLCPVLAHGSAFARVNALAGLSNSRARCPGDLERTQLADDPNEEVRAAAARALAIEASAGDADAIHALEHCAHNDISVSVAASCVTRAPEPTDGGPVLVYVVPEGSNEPVPDAFYGALWTDGMLRLGRADRRGAFFDPAAPKGTARLVSIAGAQVEP